MKHAGVRVTLTLHHTLDDVRALVERLAVHVPAALERGGEAARRRHEKVAGTAPALTLEHVGSADALKAEEWDALLGERGTFTVDGLKFLEQAFAGRRAAGGRVGLPLLRRPQPRGQARAGHVLHRGAVEGRHAGRRRGLRAGRGAPRRGPVLPDVDDVRDGLAADRGRPSLPRPQRGLEGRAGPAAGRGLRARGGRRCGHDRAARPLLRRPRAGGGDPRARVRQDVAAGLAGLRAGRRRRRGMARAADVQGARAPAQGGAAVRRRLRGRVPDVRRAGGLRRRARPSLRALSGRAGARARSQLVPAAEGLPARACSRTRRGS